MQKSVAGFSLKTPFFFLAYFNMLHNVSLQKKLLSVKTQPLSGFSTFFLLSFSLIPWPSAESSGISWLPLSRLQR